MGPSWMAFAARACASVSVTLVRNHAAPSKSANAVMPASFHDPFGVKLGHPESSYPGELHVRCFFDCGSGAPHHCS